MQAAFPIKHRDDYFMRVAIDLARNGLGTTHPNPMVGALVVSEGEIVGEGWHEKAGGPHAEVNALAAAGARAKGATLYVTLEPCSTFGRTPPCTDAIERAGIARVVAGARDPNPLHAGRGYAILRNAGIEVREDVLAEDCEDLNPIFNHAMRHNTPLMAGKIATSIDGRIASRTGESKWITGDAAREHAHLLRRYYPAIGVGAGTVLKDDPRLTSRLPGRGEWCPRRFVFDRTLRSVTAPLPALYSDEFRAKTCVVTSPAAPAERLAMLRDGGVGIDVIATVGAAFWKEFSDRLAAQGLQGILIEGGSALLSSILEAGMLDYLYAYRAPIVFADDRAVPALTGASPGSPRECWRLEKVRNEVFGDDVLTRGWLSRTRNE
ncbi:MAG TPA: bifunctional diaminohydroxyphosphoribosylaminopyrimidine deaminase/5-amino-6-(5-phosphoribosylamino)uracil reductase RibD [Opitutales bacterium]|nr:bifunctional diaminohydroxyphosphoribosylaminopyrimidine deaminase/5-amino-6-(5-phosphoribosylamino)uracil reductase RibD [Opitutales bacterium]